MCVDVGAVRRVHVGTSCPIAVSPVLLWSLARVISPQWSDLLALSWALLNASVSVARRRSPGRNLPELLSVFTMVRLNMAGALLRELKAIGPFRSTDSSISAQKERSVIKLRVVQCHQAAAASAPGQQLPEGKGSESTQELISFRCSSGLG